MQLELEYENLGYIKYKNNTEAYPQLLRITKYIFVPLEMKANYCFH